MRDGVFCTLVVELEGAARRETFLATELHPLVPSLKAAKVVCEESAIFGGEFTVVATSLKAALAKLQAMGFTVEKKHVTTWEKTADKTSIRLGTKGALPRESSAKDLIAWLEGRAKTGKSYYAIEETDARVAITGYLDGYDDYCEVQEAFFLMVEAGRACGAKSHAAFFADTGLVDPPIYCGLDMTNDAELSTIHFDEPQDMTEEDVANFEKRFALDFPAIAKGHETWLEGFAAKKSLSHRHGNAGYIRADGSFAIEAKYPALGGFREGRASFKNARGAWGFLDETGAEVIAAEFTEAYAFTEGVARVRKETKREMLGEDSWRSTIRYGFIDANGKWVIEPTLATVEDFSCGRAMITVDTKYGFLNKAGDVCVPPTFDFASAFADGRALVCVGNRYSGGKWGFIDDAGAWLIEPRFAGAGTYYEGHAPFMTDGRWGLMDLAGEIVVSPRYLQGAYLNKGRIIARADTGQGVFNARGEVIVPPEFMRITERGEMIEAMYADQTRALFTLDGKRLGELRVADNGDAAEGLVPVQLESRGKWGYADLTGAIAIAPRFEVAFAFGQGHAIARDAKGPVVIDRRGEVIAKIVLERPNIRSASAFGKSGLASVELGNQAIVALDGRVVIPMHLNGVAGLDESLIWIKYAPQD